MLSIRKMGVFGRTYRHLNRYRQILGVLIKYGFGDLIERLNFDQYIESGLQFLSSRRPYQPVERLTRARRFRMAIEELGTTYIKLGQLLSTRSDLIPLEFVEELTLLQDRVAPFPYKEVRKVFHSELGAFPEDMFAFFDEIPFASASIGQVHRARLAHGEEVAIKVQRPGIRPTMEVDLEIMLHLATLAEHHIEELAVHRPVSVVEEFARVLKKELDYAGEISSMERFARQFAHDPTIYVPRVYRAMTSERILTMEYIDGVKVTDVQGLEEAGLDKKRVVAHGANLILRQVFDFGYFHADPHPGNIRVLEREVICLLDFGMMGTIDRYTKAEFVDLIYAVVHHDEVRAAQVLLKLSLWEEEPNLRHLERDVAELMGQHLYRPLKEIHIGRLLGQLLDLTSQHHLRIPPDLFLMLKAFSIIEGVALRLDPDFDMVAEVAPFIRREKLARFQPGRIMEELHTISSELLTFTRQFPRDVLEVSRLLKQRRLSVRFEHQGLDQLIDTHDRISNKLSFAIIIAALIIGSSIIVIAKIPPLFYGISFIGIFVFIAAAIMGIWLMIAILKKRPF